MPRISRIELAEKLVSSCKITGSFLLRSGATSNVYFDKYRFEADPILLSDIASHLSELIHPDATRLVGLEMGGIPLVTALSLTTGIKAGFCRKKPKEYGTCLQVEGGLEAGEKVVIIEDVITSGGAAVDAINVLRGLDIEILRLICVIDRQSGGAQKFVELGVDFKPLFTWSELDELTGRK